MKKIRCTVTVEVPDDSKAIGVISSALLHISSDLATPALILDPSFPMGWGEAGINQFGVFWTKSINILRVEDLSNNLFVEIDNPQMSVGAELRPSESTSKIDTKENDG